MTSHRTIEICFLTILVLLGMLGICWGPPAPPSIPASSSKMTLFTAAAIAGYGWWKMRK